MVTVFRSTKLPRRYCCKWNFYIKLCVFPVLLKRHCLSAVYLGTAFIATPIWRTITSVYTRGRTVSKPLRTPANGNFSGRRWVSGRRRRRSAAWGERGAAGGTGAPRRHGNTSQAPRDGLLDTGVPLLCLLCPREAPLTPRHGRAALRRFQPM